VYAIDSLVNGALAYFAFVYKVSVVYILSSEYYAICLAVAEFGVGIMNVNIFMLTLLFKCINIYYLFILSI